MKNSLKYILILIFGISLIFYLKINIDETIKEVKKEFDNTEIYVLKSFTQNITNTIIEQSLNKNLFNFLKNNPDKRKNLEKNLEVILSKKYKYAYVLYKDENDKFKILLDGSKKEKSFFNEPFNVTNPKWKEVYNTKQAIFFKEDEIESIWMTYAHPIVVNDTVQGILAIDFSTKEIEKTLSYFLPLQNILDDALKTVIFVIIALLLFMLLWFTKNKESLKHQQSLKDREKFYKTVLDSQTNMVLILKNNEILDVNKYFLEFFDIDSIKEFNKKYFNFNKTFEYLDKSKSNKIKQNDSIDNLSKVKIKDSIFNMIGKTVQYQNETIDIFVLNDISTIEKAKNTAHKANKAKSEFLANMSHEIRTPMNAIMGLTELLLKNQLEKKQKDYLIKIQASTRLLLTIINDILDFSKIEAGKLELEYESFRIYSLANKISQLFEKNKYFEHVDFEIIVDNTLPECFIGDIVRLEQIIINLLGNSFKFTQKGSVSLHINNITGKNSKYNLSIEIKDTGIGIEKNKINKLFESFTQADTSTTRKYGGTGLGLSITKKIVDLFKGEIKVESELEKGTTFTILLNLEVDENCNIKKEIYDENNTMNYINSFKDVNILIAEDNLINQDVILGYLEGFEFNITIANNGEEAISKFNKEIDLILMDVNMPKISGYEATKEIRKISSVPILALSANARGEDYNISLEMGMNAHISKPIESIKLYTTLLKYLPKNKQKDISILKKELPKKNDFVYDFKTLNLEKVMKNLNNYELFDKIIRKFYYEYKNFIYDIEKYEPSKQKELIHKLKSTSGTIGANQLFDIVNIYYSELQNSINDVDKLEKIKLQLELLLREIKNYIDTKISFDEKNNMHKNINIEFSNSNDVSLAFENLKQCLKGKNVKEIKQSVKNLNALTLDKSNNELKEKITKFVDSYSFVKALKILESKDK